jgi:anti-sigma factor RsiW
MRGHYTELLSALLDRELRGVRHWVVMRHLRRCPICATEYRHLRHVRSMLAANRPVDAMSDSPEFFWSKVKREIEACDRQTQVEPRLGLSILDWIAQHSHAFATAVAALVAVLGIVWVLSTHRSKPVSSSAPVVVMRGSVATVEHVATALKHTVATPVQGDDSNVAVIWVSGLPWTPDMTTMKTRFATLDS